MTFLEDTTSSPPTRVAFQCFGNGPGIYIMSDRSQVPETDNEYAIRCGFKVIDDESLMYMKSEQPQAIKPRPVFEWTCDDDNGVHTPVSSVEYYK